MKNTLNKTIEWEPKTQPLLTLTGLPTNKKIILRNDNNKPLGIVSESYRLFTNRELEKLCKGIEKIGPYKIEGFQEFRNGKVMLGFLRNHSKNYLVNGCSLKEYIVISNSFDATRSLSLGTSQELCRCENQFSIIESFHRMSHKNGIDFKAETLNSIKDVYEAQRSKLYKKLELLKSKTVTKKLVDDLIVYLLNTDKKPINDTIRKEMLNSEKAVILNNDIQREMKDLGQNAFGLFNGVTWHTSHSMKTNHRSFGNTNGKAYELNNKALHYLNLI
jgi:hypothetical protein